MAQATAPTTSQSVASCSAYVPHVCVVLFRYTHGHGPRLQIDVQVDNHHLLDHIEWDLRSPLTPEAFTHQLCLDLGLSGEALPLIAHAIHEELMKHKKDAIEWGVIGGVSERENVAGAGAGAGGDDAPRDKSGQSLLKDKTGLGLGWGRAPKDGRGPRVLRSVWRDWQEAEEFGTRWEVLSQEEVERREIEKERASRSVTFSSASLSRGLACVRYADGRLAMAGGCEGRPPNSRVRRAREGGKRTSLAQGVQSVVLVTSRCCAVCGVRCGLLCSPWVWL